MNKYLKFTIFQVIKRYTNIYYQNIPVGFYIKLWRNNEKKI